MEKERKIKVLSLVALVVAVIGLTVAFAALSQTLTINGTANVDAASWDVHFENLTSNVVGDAKITKMPTLSNNNTYIGDFEVTLTKPGDSVEFCYDTVNDGTIDAVISTQMVNGIDTMTVEDFKDVWRSVYVESDWDGDGEISDEELDKSIGNIRIGIDVAEKINVGDVQNHCTSIDFSGDELPKGKISIKMNVQNIYVQK